jgi:glutamate-5-semialdehyde dehydrogenase
MRADMVAGLRGWRDRPGGRDALVEAVDHDGWRVELRRAPLGVVGFVFEGRPNVFADATGVLRAGNTVVFRIGSDALGTARAIVTHALGPALAEAGLPAGAVRLVDTPARAAGWAMFADPRLALAVARGSGEAVAQLGAVARQSGIPVSLHGTGGAWLVAGRSVDPARFAAAVRHSLDRKVCNTLNVCCVQASHAEQLVPTFLDALTAAAAARGQQPKLHVTPPAVPFVPAEWFDRKVDIRRAEGTVREPQAERLPLERVGVEWEWEESPEVTLVVVDSVEEAVQRFNRDSPRLVASLVADDPGEQDRFWATVDSPFVGNGFTRWVDGQYALGRPELGLSNWQGGRLFARGAVLSGEGVFTIRTRAIQSDPDVHR